MCLIRVYFSFLQTITKIDSLFSICLSSLWCGSEVSFSANYTSQLTMLTWHCLDSSEMGVSNERVSSIGWLPGMSVVNCRDFFYSCKKGWRTMSSTISWSV